MKAWFVNPGLVVLQRQLRAAHPGIVIGSIGDANHSSTTSDHNPDPDGSVDALDPMLGPSYSHQDAQRDVDAIVASRDERVKYIIWNHRIIRSYAHGDLDAWEWGPYTGTSDPHTGHWHISTLDKYESRINDWALWEEEMSISDDDIHRIVEAINNASYGRTNPETFEQRIADIDSRTETLVKALVPETTTKKAGKSNG